MQKRLKRNIMSAGLRNGRLNESRILDAISRSDHRHWTFRPPLDADVALAKKIKHLKRILFVKDVTPIGTT